MSGKAKGTVSLEKNGGVCTVGFNGYGASSGELLLCADKTLLISVDSARFVKQIEPIADSGELHAAFFCGGEMVMCGSNCARIKSREEWTRLYSRLCEQTETKMAAAKIYSEAEGYSDDRIAERNYYPEDYGADFEYSALFSEREVVEEEKMSDENIKGSMLAESADDVLSEPTSGDDMPSRMERDFLMSRRAAKQAGGLKLFFEQNADIADENAVDSAVKYSENEKENDSSQAYSEEYAESEATADSGVKADDSVGIRASVFRKIEREEDVFRVESAAASERVSGRKGTFLERSGEEIERLFDGERVRELEELIPMSKWAKINYDSSRYYVVGMIGNDYLCYGIPAQYTPEPPSELKGYCWWLPLKGDEPQGKGYWIMYQNLVTGEPVFPD